MVFFSSILLASSATLQQCIMLVMFFVRWKGEHGLKYEVWTLSMRCEHVTHIMWSQRVFSSCYSLKGLLFHRFCCLICLIIGCLQCRFKPFLGIFCNFKSLLFCKSFYLQCLIIHYLDNRSYLLLESSCSLENLLFYFIYSWTNSLFCFSNFLLSIFNSLTNLLLH